MYKKLNGLDVKRKSLLLIVSFSAFAALYIAVRNVLRDGKLMLFRFNLGFSIEQAEILYNYQTALVIAVSAVVFAAAIYLVRCELRCEIIFPVLSLLFGIFYMFTITPLSVPDEVAHFQAIIELTSKLFREPFDASVGIFQNSFNVYFSTWLAQAVGASLSTCNLDIPTWIVPALLAILALSAQNIEGHETCLPRGFRAALIGICALIVLTFMMTMFLTWISTQDKIIVGVQGRYFTPIIPLLLVALNNRTLVLKNDLSKHLTMLSVLLSARVVLAIIDYTMFNV